MASTYALLGLGMVILLLLIGPKSLQYHRIWRWRRRLGLYQHQQAFNAVYEDDRAYALSQSARSEQDALDYTYGEIVFEPFIALLSLIPISSDDVFYDLGSGGGKAVMATGLVYPVKKSCGIEWFQSLVDYGTQQAQQLGCNPAYKNIMDKISYFQGDVTNGGFDDATIVFINATAFIGEVWQNLSQRLDMLVHCRYVLSCTKPLCSTLWSVIFKKKVMMSWGVVWVFVHKKG